MSKSGITTTMAAVLAVVSIIVGAVIGIAAYPSLFPQPTPTEMVSKEEYDALASELDDTKADLANTVADLESLQEEIEELKKPLEPIKIGIELPLTGPAAEIGAKIKDVYDLMVKEVNEEGGILGREVVIIYGDDESKPEKGAEVVERMITYDKVHILAGGFHSSVVLVASEVSNRYGIPWVIGTAIADTITERKYPWVFRTCENSSAFYIGIGEWAARTLNVNSYALIGEETDYGRLMSDGVEATIKNLKPDAVMVSKDFVPVGETDFYPIFTKIDREKPDIFFCFVTGTSYMIAIKQAHELGLTEYAIMNGEIEHMEDIFEIAGVEAAQRYTFGGSHVYDKAITPRTLPVANHYMEVYDRIPMTQEVRCLDNILVIFDAIRRAGSTDPEALRQALEETCFVGLRGIVTFNEYNQYCPPTFMFQIQEDNQVCYYPPEAAEGEFIYPPEWTPR